MELSPDNGDIGQDERNQPLRHFFRQMADKAHFQWRGEDKPVGMHDLLVDKSRIIPESALSRRLEPAVETAGTVTDIHLP